MDLATRACMYIYAYVPDATCAYVCVRAHSELFSDYALALRKSGLILVGLDGPAREKNK